MYFCSNNVIACGAMITHLLISLNRIWAVTFPLSYRHTQATKMAFLFCAPLWTYAHVVVLPEMIPKILAIRNPLEIYGCRARHSMHKAVQILTNVVPVLVVTFAYVYIAFMIFQK